MKLNALKSPQTTLNETLTSNFVALSINEFNHFYPPPKPLYPYNPLKLFLSRVIFAPYNKS